MKAIILATTLTFCYLPKPFAQETNLIELNPINIDGKREAHQYLNNPTLSGDKLLKKSRASIGDSMNGQLGVNASQFGPAASRPIVRGQEGNRMQVLQNGSGLLDASGTSQDHAVPMNPFSVDSLEIVRGARSLLYGSSSVGGIVNITNSRIHHNYEAGFYGGFDHKYETMNQGNTLATKLDYGTNNVMFHIDGNYSKGLNLYTPAGDLPNSELEQHSIAVGSTYFTSHKNYFGLSFSSFQNIYGVITESDVDINLKQKNINFEAYHQFSSFIKSLLFRGTQSFYKHTEFEDGQVGTVFDNTGNEFRLELTQDSGDILSGVFGSQFQNIKLSALGDEAFLPETHFSQSALFAFQEISYDQWIFDLGARGEVTQLKTDNLGSLNTPQENNFYTSNIALGTTYQFNKKFSTSLNISHNERAPNYQELYAQGAHLALGIYEQGDKNLKKETSNSIELSLNFKTNKVSSVINVFTQDYSDYIALNPTGTFDDTDESGTAGDSSEDFEIFNYTSQEARIRGVEFKYDYSINHQWIAGFTTDYLHGVNQSSSTPLPRISPARAGLNISYLNKKWSSNLNWQYTFEQSQTSLNETSTSSFSLLNYSLDYTTNLASNYVLKIYGQINNIENTRARNHVSVVKDRMLLPGRNLALGLRLLF